MKKVLLFTMSAAALVASCSKEPSAKTENPVGGTQFTAVIDEGVKTELDDKNIVWCANDSISVFDETGKNFKFVTVLGGTSATFTKVTEGELQGTTFYAVYPYAKGTTIDGGTITFKTTSSYYLSGNSFTRGKEAVMTAKTTDNELHFKNFSGLLKFTVPTGVNIAKLYFYTGGGDISGTFSFELDQNGVPTVTTPPTTTDGITVLAKTGETIPAGTYYLPVIPGTYNNLRVKITYETVNGTSSEAFSINQFTVQRNKVTNIGTIYDGRSFYKWLTFENGIVPGAECFDSSNEKITYTIVDNPVKGNANPSEKSLFLQRSGSTGNNGYTVIRLDKISSGIKKNITGLVFHYKPDGVKVCPRISVKTDSQSDKKGPMKIGSQTSTSPDGFSGDDYSGKLQTDYWNQLTFTASQFGLTNFNDVVSITISPFLWSSGSVYDSNPSVSAYIDNIGFCFD